jgi:transcriptional regulator ATRX
VQFVKPRFLGNKAEFSNVYANPIKAGQNKDSSDEEVRLMKRCSFILNKKLSKFLHRKEATLLKEYLPEKYEYTIYVPLSKVQERLYRMYLQKNPLEDGKKLLLDYHFLRKVWTNLKVLEVSHQEQEKKQLLKSGKKNLTTADDLNMMTFEDDPHESVVLPEVEFEKTKWWKEMVCQEDLESLEGCYKYQIVFRILEKCQEIGEKVVIFSAFTTVLRSLEYFMEKITKQEYNSNAEKYGFKQFKSKWYKERDYLLLDGSTSKSTRYDMIRDFNNPKNKRLRAFL